MTGDSGIGKTSLLQVLFDPVLKSHPVVLNEDFQSPLVHSDDTRLLVSPDDAEPTEFYKFTLIPNGEFMLKVKFRWVGDPTKPETRRIERNFEKCSNPLELLQKGNSKGGRTQVPKKTQEEDHLGASGLRSVASALFKTQFPRNSD